MASKKSAAPVAPRNDDLGDTTEFVIKWRDRVRKEMRAVKSQEIPKFSVNLRALKPMTAPVGYVSKSRSDNFSETAELKALVVAASLPPQAKSVLPRTSAAECGWFASEAERDPFRVAAKTCDEVRFAVRYFETTGRMPHARKPVDAAAAPAAKK